MTHQNDYTLTIELAEKGLDAVPDLLSVLINNAMQAERVKYLQAVEYERSEDRKGYANGYKPKTVKTRMGDPNVQLIIAGPDDGQLSELRELVNKYKLESAITFTGLLTGQDVYAAFLDADLFVLPCRSDTFPTTIMESCLMGTPMVITDRCEMAQLVKDRVGDVVPFDAQAIADAMALLLTKGDRYKRYKSNCQFMISELFSIQTVVDRLEAVYQRAVDEKSKNKGNHHTFVTSPKKQYL